MIFKKSIDFLNNERFILLSGTAVARHSLSYWYENSEKWSKLFVDDNDYPVTAKGFFSSFNWGAIGISDAAGAIGMAVNLALNGSGAAMAATGPGGWVGIGLCIAAGSIMSSATAFAAQAMTM